MWNEPSLAGKRVLVTAGADGIGLEITRAFAEAGARVFVCDVQRANLDRVLSELPTVGGCLADVSNEAEVAAMFDAIDRELGGLDVLVNNAGIAGPTGGTPGKPVGMVCLAWAQRNGGCEALTCQFAGTRAEVRQQAVRLALSGALKRVMAATLMA